MARLCLALRPNRALLASSPTTQNPPMTIDHSMTQRALDQLLEHIARQHLSIETLQTQRSDQLDFHDVSVWSVKSALQAAFEAGKQAERTEASHAAGAKQ